MQCSILSTLNSALECIALARDQIFGQVDHFTWLVFKRENIRTSSVKVAFDHFSVRGGHLANGILAQGVC